MTLSDWQKAMRLCESKQAILLAAQEDQLFSRLFVADTDFSSSTIDAERASILVMATRQFQDSGLYAPAIQSINALVETGLAQKVLKDDEVVSWAEMAALEGDRDSLTRLELLLPGKSKDELTTKLQSSPSVAGLGVGVGKDELSKAVRGVVTVYLDLGIQVKDGVGFPNRIVGSAFQIDPKGYYITNYHVIKSQVDPSYEGYSKLSIRPSDNPSARIPASVVGWDEQLDLALLKSEPAPYTFHFAQDGQLAEGQKVFVIGSPVGLENTVTSGILSAKSRQLLSFGEVLQIDASVNPGNSGGPLVNEQGQVLGVVFAGLVGYQGLNFALPASWLKAEIPTLFQGGKISHALIGAVLVRNMDQSFQIGYRFPSANGLKVQDRLLAIDGIAVKSISEAQKQVADKVAGTLVCLRITREGKDSIWLGQTSQREEKPLESLLKRDVIENILSCATGMQLEHVSGPRGTKGVYKVVQIWPGSAADETGIKEGDTIRFLRYATDPTNDTISFDLSIKSTSTGYIERTVRLEVSTELYNLI
ncbi:MAG TPA: trypsin-like peptidase domain-containing protein [Spirochaetales bacterium]|nr:trypsin-like peptidase domain-containing protein [Spirochaetales bacterium]